MRHFAEKLGAPLTNYLTGINDLRAQACISACQTLAVVLLTLLLLHDWKLAGVGFALLAGEVVGSLVLPLLFVARQMRCVAASLPLAQMASTGTGVLVVVGICLGVGTGCLTTHAGCALGLVALPVNALLQWRSLPPVVRATFLGIIRSGRFIARFSR